jgi:hypothetical protein
MYISHNVAFTALLRILFFKFLRVITLYFTIHTEEEQIKFSSCFEY